MTRALALSRAALTILGAFLLLLCAILPSMLLSGDASLLDWVRGSTWPLLSVLALLQAALMPFVMISIYAWQTEETGILGLVGLMMAVVGLLGFEWFQFDMALVWPVLASAAPELIAIDGPMFRHLRFAFVHLWMGPVHSIGTLLFGIALFRARVLPRTASALFTIGVFLSAGVLFPPLWLRFVPGVIGAIAMGWIGVIMWKRPVLAHA